MDRRILGEPEKALAAIVSNSPLLNAALRGLEECRLPDGFLGAGAVAQTVWNALFGYPDGYGIIDLDIVYFEPGQTAESERDLAGGIVRANRVQVPRAVFEKKAARWASQWTQLEILPWERGVGRVGERLLRTAGGDAAD